MVFLILITSVKLTVPEIIIITQENVARVLLEERKIGESVWKTR